MRSISVDVNDVLSRVPRACVAAGMEDVNHEIYGGIYSQLLFGEAFQEPPPLDGTDPGVSGMWRSFTTGDAIGAYELTDPFKGVQSQRLRYVSGTGGSVGTVGIENRGLNRQGVHLVGGREYEGRLTLRAQTPQRVQVSFQNADGSATYATTEIVTSDTGWRTYDFTLTPTATDSHARFAIELTAPGEVDAGYAFVEPGEWGRYKGLHVRKDVAELMVAQGLHAIRFGGCANGGCGDVSDYKWRSMVGDPVDRPVTKGWWYPYESNGWAIFEFLELGEAMGIEAVPSLNIDETPADIAELMDLLAGRPRPVRRIQLGNEEVVDDSYFEKFEALADVIWTRDPSIVLVVGDFAYAEVITDPYDFTGGGKVSTLAAQEKILQLAKEYDAEVHFDIHLWTGQAKGVSEQIQALDSYAGWLERLGGGARFKVVVFELNADSHDLTRALGNAYAINALQRRPFVDVVSSANALQVEGQNDNGWNQGLVFMNQSQVWAQPPYYVHQLKAESYQPNAVRAEVSGADEALFDVTALVDDDRSRLTLDVVNASPDPLTYAIALDGFTPAEVDVRVLGGGRPHATNTATNPMNLVPRSFRVYVETGSVRFTFEPYSYTSLRFGAAR